jgi:hypothetical protein
VVAELVRSLGRGNIHSHDHQIDVLFHENVLDMLVSDQNSVLVPWYQPSEGQEAQGWEKRVLEMAELLGEDFLKGRQQEEDRLHGIVPPEIR